MGYSPFSGVYTNQRLLSAGGRSAVARGGGPARGQAEGRADLQLGMALLSSCMRGRCHKGGRGCRQGRGGALGAFPQTGYVPIFRKGGEHLIPNGIIGETPVVGGDDTFGSKALPNVRVVGFRVERRIRQPQADGRASCSHAQQSWQSAHVGPMTSRVVWKTEVPPTRCNSLAYLHADYS